MKLLTKIINSITKFFRTIAWCLSLSWNASKYYTVIRIITEILTPLFAIIASFIGKYVIDLLAGHENLDVISYDINVLLISLLIGLFVIGIIHAATQKTVEYCQAIHEDILNSKLTLIMMEHALSADLEYFDNPYYHDKLTAANSDSHAIVYIIWNVLRSVSAVASFLGAFLLICQTSYIYGIVIIAAAFPSSIVTAHYTKLLYKLNLGHINDQRQMGYCQNLATNKLYAQDLRLFSAGDKLKNRYKRIWSGLFTKKRNAMRKRTILTGALEILPELAVAWIGISIAMRVLYGSATVGDYSLYTGLVGQLWAAISMLSYSVMNIYDNHMKIENYKAIEAFENHVTNEGTQILKQIDTIEFKNISFTYPNTKESVLSDVSFYLHKDQKVALVGLNGSGKSTLIKLLLRLYEPSKGIIRINDTEIREYTLESLRENFSVYFQDMYNYSFSLRENFLITDDGHGDIDKSMEDALKATNCDDILEKTSGCFNINISRLFSPEGIELSGGQHQKLALARTIFRRHSALILDEPSSNLDPKAEHDIFESLRVLTNGKMTIFTSHRLANVFLAHRIIVLEKGKIVEDGTQEELLENKQRYAELFRYQQEKYVEEQKEKE